MKSLVRSSIALLACTVAGLGPALASTADNYPSRPVEIVVPFSPGSSPDIVARHIGKKLNEELKQTFVVVNRGGAAGSLAASSVARSAPDGYTVFFIVNSIVTMNQFVYPNLDYNPEKDFAPVSMVAEVPYVLIANKDFPHKTLPDLVNYAKQHPNKVDYASAGIGGAGHVIMELFSSLADVEMTHIPYGKGNPLLDVIAGQVPLIFQPPTTAIEQIKQGTVIPLGVTGERLAQLPDVPSISEFIPGYAADGWQAVLVPAGTPEPVIKTLNEALAKALKDPSTEELFQQVGIKPRASSPEELQALIKTDAEKWKKVIEAAGVEAN